MKNKEEKKAKCMACECPCEKHMVHAHHDHNSRCERCGHMHKSNGSCDCGCR